MCDDLTDGLKELECKAIERLKYAENLCRKLFPDDMLTLCYSGGKDSDVILHLALKSGIRFRAVYNMTGIDHPDVYREIRGKFEELRSSGIECVIRRWEKSIFQLIEEKLFLPTRKIRFCCKELKERTGDKFIITGVRWAESWKRQRRKDLEVRLGFSEYIKEEGDSRKELILSSDNDEKRKMIENCEIKSQRAINPIVDWSDNDVFEYIYKNNIKISDLYKFYNRIGCVLCPMSGARQKNLDERLAPGYKKAFLKSCERMIEKRKQIGKPCKENWNTPEKLYNWWVNT